MAWGLEAEYARSVLLGSPELQKPVLDACREWLTKCGNYTYGSGANSERWKSLQGEILLAKQEPCAFLGRDGRCIMHAARPIVCRAYGVTHVPSPLCKRPIGLGESGSRIHWDANHPKIPLKAMWWNLLNQIDEPRFSRQGFFAMMVFEALATRELAGLMDDGKIPLVKLRVVWGGSESVLWQEEIDAMWRAEAADRSILDQPPIEERDGNPVMVADVVMD